MKLTKRVRLATFGVCIALGLCPGAGYSQSSPQKQSPPFRNYSVSAPGPKIWLQDREVLPVAQVGASAPTLVSQGKQAQPIAMTADDVDADGITDLLVGYAVGSGGVLALYHGNIDAFAPQTQASFQAIGRGQFPAPFLPQVKTFVVPIRPDLLATGNFLGLGHTDLIMAARGGSEIYVLPGDGKGNFGPPRTFPLAAGASVVALAAGRVGNSRSFDDVVVSVSDPGRNIFSLSVYTGTEKGLVSVTDVPLSAPASNFIFENLGDPGQDVVFLSGGDVYVLRSSSMQAERIPLPVEANGLALGSFVYDRSSGLQLALVSSDGSIHIAAHSQFDPRLYTAEELKLIGQARSLRQPNPFVSRQAFSANDWKIVETIPGVISSESAQSPVFFRSRISSNGADDLVVLDSLAGQMSVISHPEGQSGATTFAPAQVSVRPYSGSPVSALPLRTNIDGRPGVVVIHRGEVTPSVMMPLPDPTFTVNTTADGVNPGACAAAIAGQCTLREAVIEANNTAGTDTIMVPAGTYTLALPKVVGDCTAQHGALYINDSVNIVGAGQTTTIIQAGTSQATGVDFVMAVNEDLGSANCPITNATASLSNLTLKFGHNRGTHGNDGDGGCMEFDTGSSGNANLTMDHVTLDSCTTTQGEGGGIAIFNFTAPNNGLVTVTNSLIQNNSASDTSSPTIAATAGGIWVSQNARMSMTNSQVLNNNATQVSGDGTVAGEGGGITITNNTPNSRQTVIHGSTISGNDAAGNGGGIHNESNLLIDQSSIISNNTAGTANLVNAKDGGGLWTSTSSNGCPSTCTDVTTLNKVTITGNTTSGNGGGIAIGNGSGAGSVTMTFSRLAGNAALAGKNLSNNGAPVSVTDNWWGTNTPSSTISTIGTGATTFDPFIELTHTASPATIRINQSTTLTGSLAQDNHGTAIASANLTQVVGLPITFDNAVLGSIPQAQPETLGNPAPTATATFNAGNSGGEGSADATVDQETVTADIVILEPLRITKSFTPTTVAVNAPSTLTFSVTNPNVIAVDGSFTDTLPANLLVASTPGVTNTCGGTVTANAGSSSVSFSNAALPVGDCTITVKVASAIDNTYGNSVTIDSTAAGTGTQSTSSANLTVINPPSIAKQFGAASIPLNGSTSLTFTLSSTNANLMLNGVAFTDSLPAGLVVATPSNLTATCNGTASASAGSNSVALSAATLAPGASCTVSLNVTGTSAGDKNNSVQVTSTNGGTGNTATASLTVIGPPTIAKSFGAASIPLNGTTSLSFTVTNPNTVSALSGIAFTDTLPAGLTVATTPNITGTCGSGTIAAVAGSGSISLSGGTLAASPATGSTCTFSVDVTGTAAGTKNNTTGVITSTEGGPGTTSNTATITVVAPPTITKAFSPTTINLNANSTITFTISNPNASTAVSGVAFNDSLTSGLVVATPNGVVNGCGGTLTATAGSSSISLSGGTVASNNSSCTIKVDVTGTTSGTKNNTTGPISSTNGGTGAVSNTATLLVASPPTIAKAFGAASIPLNGTTTLSFNLSNPNTGLALTGVAFTDSLPAGLQVAATPSISNTCNGTLTATSGSGTISLSGGTLSASGSCAISVDVTGTTAGVKNNTTGDISSTETGAGLTSNTATITVVAPPTISKAFGSSSIPLNGTTTLTFSITNPNATSLTGVAFTDSLPAGLPVASAPNASNSCGGTLLASAGSGTVSLSGGTVSGGGSCQITVNVTGTTAGSKSNTTGAINSAESGLGATSNTAIVVVVAPPSINKAFGVTNIPVGGVTSLTLTITNPNGGTALTGVAVIDNFPAGLQVASTPGASNTCGGTFTAVAGGTGISLSGGSVAAGSSCIVSANVTTTTSGSKLNTTGSVTSTNGGTGNTGSATIGSGDFGISVIPTTQTIPPGHMAVYTLTISSNTGFQGTIDLTCSGGPPNSTCTVQPSSVSLVSGDEMARVTIDLAVPKGASKGTSTVTFTGTSGALTHSISAKLTVK